MRTCTEIPLFKLRVGLWGDDPIWDDNLVISTDVRTFPDGSPTSTSHAVFEMNLKPSTLDEDWDGRDELYGKLTLQDLARGVSIVRNTNTVKRSF